MNGFGAASGTKPKGVIWRIYEPQKQQESNVPALTCETCVSDLSLRAAEFRAFTVWGSRLQVHRTYGLGSGIRASNYLAALPASHANPTPKPETLVSGACLIHRSTAGVTSSSCLGRRYLYLLQRIVRDVVAGCLLVSMKAKFSESFLCAYGIREGLIRRSNEFLDCSRCFKSRQTVR